MINYKPKFYYTNKTNEKYNKIAEYIKNVKNLLYMRDKV